MRLNKCRVSQAALSRCRLTRALPKSSPKLKMATAKGDAFIAADIIVLAMASSKATVAGLMKAAGVDAKRLNAAFDAQRQGRTVDTDHGEDAFEALTKYATNLTDHARKGKLDPVIGREEEVRRTIQISHDGQRTIRC